MALINNNYVWVESEGISNEVEVSDHPVEQGEPVSDHVQRQPIQLSMCGWPVGMMIPEGLLVSQQMPGAHHC